MKVVLLSDTHGYLPTNAMKYFEGADEIWHAGDIGDLAVVDTLERYATVRAVYGNIDGHEARVRFPEDLHFTVNGLKVYMTHIGGYPDKYNSRTRPIVLERKPDMFISGHSHILKVMWDKNKTTLHMNPGAAGAHGFHKVMTMIRFTISKQGKIEQPEVIELGPRRMQP